MMDNETRQLVEEFKSSLSENKKPFYQSLLQSVIVALIMAIPTMIIMGNKFENKMVEIVRKQSELEVKQVEKQREIAKTLKQRTKSIDYNFSLIEEKNPELHFIIITED